MNHTKKNFYDLDKFELIMNQIVSGHQDKAEVTIKEMSQKELRFFKGFLLSDTEGGEMYQGVFKEMAFNICDGCV